MNWPAMACAGTSVHSLSAAHRRYRSDSNGARSNGSARRSTTSGTLRQQVELLLDSHERAQSSAAPSSAQSKGATCCSRSSTDGGRTLSVFELIAVTTTSSFASIRANGRGYKHSDPVVRTRQLVRPARSSRGHQRHTARCARAKPVATIEAVVPRASQLRLLPTRLRQTATAQSPRRH